jgi:prolipoprotein diacylglyceryltransferase
LYEALCYLGTGILLKGLYHYALDKMKKGWFLGIFFIGIFGTRFLIEFIKEPQVAFEQGMTLNMGQLLSIPFVLMGIGLLVWGAIKKEPAKRIEPQKKGRV